MKIERATHFLNLGVALLISAASLVSRAGESSLQGINLKVCSAAKCLELKSPHAWGSQLKPMFVMKDVELTITDLKTKNKKITLGTAGRFDFQTNQIVVSEIDKGQKIDRVFNLNNLNESRFVVN